jgi:hypothetical protein
MSPAREFTVSVEDMTALASIGVGNAMAVKSLSDLGGMNWIVEVGSAFALPGSRPQLINLLQTSSVFYVPAALA